MPHTPFAWEASRDVVNATTLTAFLRWHALPDADGLRALRIGRGDVVALYLPMLPEVAAAYFAIAKIGAIVMPLFSGFGRTQQLRKTCISKSQPSWLGASAHRAGPGACCW